MEYNADIKPNLIGPVMKNTVYKITRIKSTNGTISDKISEAMTNFYADYIEQNKAITVIILGIIAFFVYRYYDKQQENFSNQDYRVLKNRINKQTNHLMYSEQPTLNPLYSVDSQKEPVNYPPGPLSVNVPNKGIMYTKTLYEEPQNRSNMINTDGYDYGAVKTANTRSYYTGAHNPYKGAKNTNIINALGYPVDFNTTTGNFVGGMTSANSQNIMDYQTVLESMNQNLADNLQVGPKYLGSKNKMDPPYAPDF